ncbi:MAG: TIM barrel protein [Clostridiales bacterium]|nr:TIM barrel protein [Clostridiales bacterium]
MSRFYVATVGDGFERQLKEHNIGVEFDYFCQAENLEGAGFMRSAAEITRLKKAYGYSEKNMVLHAPFNELHPAAIDREALELAKKRMKQAYGMCESFAVKKMVAHSGYLPFVYFKSWHRDRSVEFWTEFMADKPEDFILCIENVLEDEPYMMAELMEAIEEASGKTLKRALAKTLPVPNIGICLDIGHANCMSEVALEEWIRTLAPYIRHFHLHNNDGKGDRHLAFHEGQVDIAELLDLAKELCREDTTYTVESIDCEASVKWLSERGHISRKGI